MVLFWSIVCFCDRNQYFRCGTPGLGLLLYVCANYCSSPPASNTVPSPFLGAAVQTLTLLSFCPVDPCRPLSTLCRHPQ